MSKSRTIDTHGVARRGPTFLSAQYYTNTASTFSAFFNFATPGYYASSESTFSAFFNFAKLTLYRNGKLDKKFIFQAGVIIGAELLDSYMLGSFAQSMGVSDLSARFVQVQAVSFVLGVAKEYLYSNVVTQHATPNANLNFLAMWENNIQNEEHFSKTPQAIVEYNRLLSNFYSESSTGTYQTGNVARGILSSASKLAISVWNLLRGSIGEFLVISAYIIVTGVTSFILNKKLFSLFKEVKTLDNELKQIPLVAKDEKDTTEKFKNSLEKQQEGESKMQRIKVAISIITILQDILSVRRGVRHFGSALFNSQENGEATNLKFNEGTTFVSWVNANAFRIVDSLHRVTATNRVLQNFFRFTANNCEPLDKKAGVESASDSKEVSVEQKTDTQPANGRKPNSPVSLCASSEVPWKSADNDNGWDVLPHASKVTQRRVQVPEGNSLRQ